MKIKKILSRFFNRCEDRRWDRALDEDNNHKAAMIITHGLGGEEWSNLLKEANRFSAMFMNLSLDQLEETNGCSCTQEERNDFHLVKDIYIFVVLPFKQITVLFSNILKFLEQHCI